MGLACPLPVALPLVASLREALPQGWRVVLRQSKRFPAFQLELKVVIPAGVPLAVARPALRAAGLAI
jgi:hypothetical protein